MQGNVERAKNLSLFEQHLEAWEGDHGDPPLPTTSPAQGGEEGGPTEDARDTQGTLGMAVSRSPGFHIPAHHPLPSPLFIISSPIKYIFRLTFVFLS